MPEAGRRWRVVILREPEKVLDRMPRDLLERMRSAIRRLAGDPRTPGYKKLKGHDLYAFRVGGWRIIYAVEDDQLVIVILIS